MSRSAKVRSIDALEHLAAAVRTFAEEASVALADLGMDLHRAIQWVQYDQKEYWTQELRRAEEAVAEAKLNLERRRTFLIGDQRPSCREQEKALEAAKHRLQVAREKLEAVKRWTRLLEHESMECRGAVAPLVHWIQADVPRATALLRRMSAALESYVSLELSEQVAAGLGGEGSGFGAQDSGFGVQGSGEEVQTHDLKAESQNSRGAEEQGSGGVKERKSRAVEEQRSRGVKEQRSKGGDRDFKPETADREP